MNITIVNTCSSLNIVGTHALVLENAIDIYRRLIPAYLLNVRLMGSVPRGNFRPFDSDIDFIAIVTKEINNEKVLELDEERRKLESQYKMYRKIDLEIIEISKIKPFREFVFVTDSVSVFGSDLYPEKKYEIELNELAELTTPNLKVLINEYREGLENSENENCIKQYSRWIGKDILKALRWKLIIDKGSYYKNAQEICNSLVNNYIEDQVLFKKLLDVYINPTADWEYLKRILTEVERNGTKYTEIA